MQSLEVTVAKDRVRPPSDPDERWSADTQVIHLSGVQATIRMLIDVLRRDRAGGHRTAAFVSGYQGSPLAGFDRELQRALSGSIDVEIVHQPAVNEELGVTAVMGSQLAGRLGTSRLDGVLGVWYAKAPGLDRSMDALRHANFAGAAPLGGAIALVGDDPTAKSSTLPSASEGALADLCMPILFPRSLDEVLELGRHAVALSRWSGSWVALKMMTSVADGEGTLSLHQPKPIVLPGTFMAKPVTGDLLTPSTLTREPVVLTERLEAAAAFGDANDLNRIMVDPPTASVALVAAGTVFSELIEALRLLGLDPSGLGDLGLRLAEVRMPFPIGDGFARRVSSGVREIIVLEERRELVETQLLSLLARQPGHPAILGRRDGQNRPFVPRHGSLDAATLAGLLEPVLRTHFGERLAPLPTRRQRIELSDAPSRVPWFCSGCPHSVSTVVPEGTLVGIGIGCHSIVNFMPEERVGRSIGVTQMGGEGAQWIGMAPFVSDRHIVANLGDGTFFHSGQLAVRAAVAAGVSMTYKILWNGVSAMTGGQDVVGAVSTPTELAGLLLMEGVKEVVITTEDASRYRRRSLPHSVSVRPREEVVEVQRRLAAVDGVTALIHDQACATELRRARKRGLASTPDHRVVINERVCEGCGDCQVKSNCLSLQTVDTPFGPKTRIDEESCNIDLSCLQGDCPAFALVKRGRRRAAPKLTAVHESEPASATVVALDRPVTIRVAGIGGTGVVTTAHLLAWAALSDGLEVWGLDQTGLSQKAGPVVSDLRIGPGASDHSNVLGVGEVDVLLVADLLAAGDPSALRGASRERTAIVGSTSAPLTGPMVLGQHERRVPAQAVQHSLSEVARPGRATFLDVGELTQMAGLPASVANVALLGVAAQLGLLPVSVEALAAAIERNGVATDANLAGLRAGRLWAAGICEPELDVVTDADGPLVEGLALSAAQRQRVHELATDLEKYQNARLAHRLLDLVEQAAAAEARAGGDGRFGAAVAAGYHKLLAYKDEYEVARLLLEYPTVDGRTTWLLHPPILRAHGLKHKIRLGPWARPAVGALRAGRVLRGTVLDPFGRTHLRRTERQLPVEYAEVVRSMIPKLSAHNLDAATEIARLPDLVRGYEEIKERSVANYRTELSEQLAAWAGGELNRPA